MISRTFYSEEEYIFFQIEDKKGLDHIQSIIFDRIFSISVASRMIEMLREMGRDKKQWRLTES